MILKMHRHQINNKAALDLEGKTDVCGHVDSLRKCVNCIRVSLLVFPIMHSRDDLSVVKLKAVESYSSTWSFNQVSYSLLIAHSITQVSGCLWPSFCKYWYLYAHYCMYWKQRISCIGCISNVHMLLVPWTASTTRLCWDNWVARLFLYRKILSAYF